MPEELRKKIIEAGIEPFEQALERRGRKSSNLSRTLKTMERLGIVTLVKEKKQLKPIVNATDVRVEFGLTHLA